MLRPVREDSIYLPILRDQGDVHVRVAGRPLFRPLLLLHGCGPGAARSPWKPGVSAAGEGREDSWRTWKRQLPAFSALRRVYALDLPGWGLSSGKRLDPADPESARVMAQAVLRIMDTLDVASADVGGVGWGGCIALELALAAPEAAGKLILVSPEIASDEIAAVRYAGVTHPAWLAWSGGDPDLPPEAGRGLVEALPGASLALFEGNSHWPHQDQAEAFNELAVQFLKGR
jgi:pimeloyl-ACP methyl ester carboxylesterase